MTEFVALPPPPPNHKNHIRGCHGTRHFHIAHTELFLLENFVSHLEGRTEQIGLNLKDPRSAG